MILLSTVKCANTHSRIQSSKQSTNNIFMCIYMYVCIYMFCINKYTILCFSRCAFHETRGSIRETFRITQGLSHIHP